MLLDQHVLSVKKCFYIWMFDRANNVYVKNNMLGAFAKNR